MQFVSEEVHEYQKHYATLKVMSGADATPDMVNEILEGMGKFCENDLWPLNTVADKEGCTWVDSKTVKTPTGFKDAYNQYVDGGWQGLAFPEKYGGQNLPWSLALMKSELLASACWTWSMFPGLSKGAVNTIMLHATEELKDAYLPRMVAGTFSGTMCLTEPQCGSDLAQVSTMATPQDDGTYLVSGTKIFISGGDHDLTDQVIHCVLARTPGAPPGTAGISLFLVPKFEVDHKTLEVGAFNNVHVDRIEDKMGCHGSPTCQMNFDGAKGYLIGTKDKGLNHMFTFINTSRLGTAIQGATSAELAYQGSVWYAKERLAMRSLTGKKNPTGPADPIIVHPDVRKNLLTQKAIVEGGSSIIYECAKLADQLADCEMAGDAKGAAAADDAMGFMTPILKGFLTEHGLEAANLGVQVYGGHGYIVQNKMEQIVRDCRIGTIWEGTTGIQGLDLLGRKVMLQKLKPVMTHAAELRSFALKTIMNAPTPAARSHAIQLLKLSLEWQYVTVRIGMGAKTNRDAIGLASVDFLMYSGYVQMAKHWLMMELAAEKALAAGSTETDFYDGKRQTAEFYYKSMLPRTRGLVSTMLNPPALVMGMKESQFGVA
jgi:alkylation response protein AidB-like acyl-CoA dehydrogenase